MAKANIRVDGRLFNVGICAYKNKQTYRCRYDEVERE